MYKLMIREEGQTKFKTIDQRDNFAHVAFKYSRLTGAVKIVKGRKIVAKKGY